MTFALPSHASHSLRTGSHGQKPPFARGSRSPSHSLRTPSVAHPPYPPESAKGFALPPAFGREGCKPFGTRKGRFGSASPAADWLDGRSGARRPQRTWPFLPGVNQAEGLVPSSQRARGEL
jgi:hypothetical protein